ncbi:short-chain fatty acid transporter [Escherichia coli]|nr:short-chain fatty acid transporter [Escherichia coli]
MIGRISRFMTRFVSRWLPDPLIFAMLLTLLTFVIALWLTPQTPISMVKMWGDGFWNLLAFGMQMALIIVTGHALASSAPVKSLLRTAASAAKTLVQGVMLVTFFGSVACVINWGFGLVVGAMFAREVARRVPGSDYPLLIACAYIGFLTWGGGFSGSMPLLAATPGNPVEHIAGLIPVGDTLFSGFNIFITVALIVVMPFITRMMMPKPSDVVSIDPKLLAMYFSEHGFNITINTVNLMFMIAGLLLHKTPMAYMRAISAAARSTAGILVQFPFYAGIQLMMEHSGLGGLITEFFINVANKDTFPVMTFFSSALINFAVPSGGGHWVIQGPFVIPAAQALGADLMGYCITALLFSGVIFVVGLTLF